MKLTPGHQKIRDALRAAREAARAAATPAPESAPSAPGAEQAATGKRLRKASDPGASVGAAPTTDDFFRPSLPPPGPTAPASSAPATSASPSRRPPPAPAARPAATPATSAARPAATPPPPSRPSSPPASGPFGKFEFDLDGPGEGSPPPAASSRSPAKSPLFSPPPFDPDEGKETGAPASTPAVGKDRGLGALEEKLRQQAATARGPAESGTVVSPGTTPRTVEARGPAARPSPAPAPAPAATPLFGSLKRPASGPRRLPRWITVPAAAGIIVGIASLAKEYRGEIERFLANIDEGCAAADDGDEKSGNDGVSAPDDSAAADDSAGQASAQPQCPVPGDLELTVDDPAFSWYSGYDLDGWKFKPNFGQGTLIVSCPNGTTIHKYSTGNDRTAKAAEGDFSDATDQQQP